MSTFVELYILGRVELEDIDRFIEVWHSNRYETRSLHEFLGLTADEYAKWVEDPTVLRILRLVPSNNQNQKRKQKSHESR
jgi:hypothetical protein